MTFHPKINQAEFNCFWSTNKGWGRACISASSLDLEVIFGELDIEKITLPASQIYRNVDEISHGSASIYADSGSVHIFLTGSMPLSSGTKLSLKLRQ